MENLAVMDSPLHIRINGAAKWLEPPGNAPKREKQFPTAGEANGIFIADFPANHYIECVLNLDIYIDI